MQPTLPIRRPGTIRTRFTPPRFGPGSGTRAPRRPARRAQRWVGYGWRRRVLLFLIGLAACAAFASAGAALAYWAASDSSNPAAAGAATLTAPTAGTTTGSTPGSVSISWTAPGYGPTSYTVYRCDTVSCTPSVAITNGTCSGVITATSCTDTDGTLAPGHTYYYAVQAQLYNWQSPLSATFSGATTPASQLGFTVQPGIDANIQAAGTGSFDVDVAIQDSLGSTVTSDNVDTVTLAIDNNPSAGVLACTNSGDLTVTVLAGIAHFTGCSITTAGAGYTLTATSTGLTQPSNANAFNITAGAASQLLFTTSAVIGPPSASATLGPITVQEQDVNGNPAPAGLGGVTVSLSGPTGSVFADTSGGTSVSAVTIGSGSSTADFFYGNSNSGSPQITAASGGLTSAQQTETIGADKLVFTTSPVTGTATDSPTLGPITVQLENASNTPITPGSPLTVSLSSTSAGTHEFAETSGGTPVTSVTISGSPTASFYYGDEAAGSPQITASAVGVTSTPAQTETINAGPAAGLTFTGVTSNLLPASAPCTGTVGSPSFICTVTGGALVAMGADVTLIDQFQNVVTNTSGSAITVSLSANSGVLLPGAVTIANNASTSGGFSVTISALTTVTATATVNSNSVTAKLQS